MWMNPEWKAAVDRLRCGSDKDDSNDGRQNIWCGWQRLRSLYQVNLLLTCRESIYITAWPHESQIFSLLLQHYTNRRWTNCLTQYLAGHCSVLCPFLVTSKCRPKVLPDLHGAHRAAPFPVGCSCQPAVHQPKLQDGASGSRAAWYARLLPGFRCYSLIDPGGMARWVGVGTQYGIRTRDVTFTTPTLYHTATTLHLVVNW